jgi:hypothetical protein
MCASEAVAGLPAVASVGCMVLLDASMDSQFTHLAWIQTDRKEGECNETTCGADLLLLAAHAAAPFSDWKAGRRIINGVYLQDPSIAELMLASDGYALCMADQVLGVVAGCMQQPRTSQPCLSSWGIQRRCSTDGCWLRCTAAAASCRTSRIRTPPHSPCCCCCCLLLSMLVTIHALDD